MVYRAYQVRQIEVSDRAKWESWAHAEKERGDFEEAQGARDFLKKWEAEQGQEKEELVCPICQRRFLQPRARGTSRPHTGWDVLQPSWDRVRQLRNDIQALEADLDLLEVDAETD